MNRKTSNGQPSLPIPRLFIPNGRTGAYREARFDVLYFTHRDIEYRTTDGDFKCVYCDRLISPSPDPPVSKHLRSPVPFDFQPWATPDSVYRLCDWCKPWYIATFRAMDEKWVAQAWRNLNSRTKSNRPRYRKVRREIDEREFQILARTLLIPFRFYYPLEVPSVDRNWSALEDASEIPYSWDTIAIMPQRLNSILRQPYSLSLEKLIEICRGLELPPGQTRPHGQLRELAKEFQISESCISDIAAGKRFANLHQFDKRLLAQFRGVPGETPNATMWNWDFQVNPDLFRQDPESHHREFARALASNAFPTRTRRTATK